MQPKHQKLSLKNRALQYLSLREHSRLELGRKLARYAEEGEDIDAVLDFLEKAKFLSCERFSETLVRRRADSYGNSRILAELQTHGLDPELMAQNKAQLAESEVARACAVWQKKFGPTMRGGDGNSNDEVSKPTPEQRSKQIRFLAQRGFSSRAIQAALRSAGNGDVEVSEEIDLNE